MATDGATTGDEPGMGFFGKPRCDGKGFLLCDDFEDATLDTSRWKAEGAIKPSVDDTRAARGTRSLHVRASDNGFSFVRTSAIFPVANNRYYGRMFVYFDALPTAPNWAHWTIAEAVGSGNGSRIRVGGQLDSSLGVERWGVGSDGGPTGDWTTHDGDPAGAVLEPATRTWVCVEWLHDGEAHETRLWLDDVEHPSQHTTATRHGGNAGAEYRMPAFESVWLGWWLYQPNPTPPSFDLWIDAVVFDDAPIGCAG